MNRTNGKPAGGVQGRGADATRDAPGAELDAVLDAVERDCAAGRPVDVEDLARRHPALAAELRPAVAAVLAMHGRGDRAEGSASRPSAPREVLEGDRRLGDYRLLRELGRGGMGVVYEAEQVSLGRKVALKVLPYVAALDPRALQRFRNEARAAAGLEHPHVVSVYGVGCERATHFLAMRLIDGPPLSEVVARARAEAGLEPEEGRDPLGGPVPIGSTALPDAGSGKSDPLAATVVPGQLGWPSDAESSRSASSSRSSGSRSSASAELSSRSKARHKAAARLIKQAAEALEYAHSLGVVHRDVKPSNLLLDSKGDVWVADFGLAQLDGDSGLTMTGDLLGTLRYMSPEQATGRRGLVDHRSDVYSLGLTLYELLTLRPAFPQNHRADLVAAVTRDEPARPRKLEPGVPRDLETVLLKATEKDPAKRYQTAKAFAEDLGRFLNGEPVLARRATVADRSAKWVSRHRSLSISAAAVLAVVAVASTLSTVEISAAYESESKHRQDAETATIRESDQRKAAEADYRLALAAVERMLTQVADGPLAEDFAFREAREKLLRDAEGFYTELIASHPADAEALFGRAKVRRLLLDPSLAEDAEAAIRLAPDAPGRRGWLGGWLAHHSGDHARAVELLEAALRDEPDDVGARADLGWALVRAGRRAEGEGHLREAARRDPALALPHRSLADMFMQTEDFGPARESAEAGLRADPRDPWARAAAARVYLELGEYEAAVGMLDDATLRRVGGARSESRNLLWDRAEALRKLGRHQESLSDYATGFAFLPDAWWVYKKRAAALFRLGRYADALADVERAARLEPKDASLFAWQIQPEEAAACPDPAFLAGELRLADEGAVKHGAHAPRGWLMAGLGRYREAQSDLAAAAEKGGRADPRSHAYLALVSLAAGDPAAYRDVCREMTRLFAADDAETRAKEASTLTAWAIGLGPAAVDDYAAALAIGRRDAEARPRSRDGQKSYGGVLYRAGRYEEAAGRLREAIRLPGHPLYAAYAGYFLAMAEARLGHPRAAREAFAASTAWLEAPERQAAGGLTWQARLVLGLLRREAEAVLAPVEASRP